MSLLSGMAVGFISMLVCIAIKDGFKYKGFYAYWLIGVITGYIGVLLIGGVK